MKGPGVGVEQWVLGGGYTWVDEGAGVNEGPWVRKGGGEAMWMRVAVGGTVQG